MLLPGAFPALSHPAFCWRVPRCGFQDKRKPVILNKRSFWTGPWSLVVPRPSPGPQAWDLFAVPSGCQMLPRPAGLLPLAFFSVLPVVSAHCPYSRLCLLTQPKLPPFRLAFPDAPGGDGCPYFVPPVPRMELGSLLTRSRILWYLNTVVVI